MEDGLTIKIEGLEEVKRALAMLPERIAKNVLRKATLAGAAFLRNEIKKASPVREAGGKGKKISKRGADRRMPGFLKKNISAWFMRRKSNMEVIHYGVVPRGQAYYGYIVEKGHAAGSKKALAEHSYLKRKKKSVEHLLPKLTFVSPQPFIMPAYQGNYQNIIDRMKKRASIESVKEMEKLGFKATEGPAQL